MILGIGVDICHVPRIARLACNPRFAARILSPSEYAHFSSLSPSQHKQFLSVRWVDSYISRIFKQTNQMSDLNLNFVNNRWAIKESAYKALYPSYRPSWKDLTFLSNKDSRKPILTVTSDGYEDITLHASVSHDGEYVFATVLAESKT